PPRTGELVERVVRAVVQWRSAGGGAQALVVELVHVARAQAGDREAHVGRVDDARHEGGRLHIHLRAAVLLVQLVGVARHAVRGRVGGALRVDRRGELELEAAARGAHLAQLEGRRAAPLDALQPLRVLAARAPAAVRHADEERTIRAPRDARDAAREAHAERVARALPDAVDLLEGDADERRVELVADEDLVLEERPEAPRGVPHEAGRRAAHLVV